MKIKYLAFAFALLILPGTAQAQQAPATPTKPSPEMESTSLQIQILHAELSAKLYAMDPDGQKDKAQAPNKLAELYRKAALDPTATEGVIANIYNEFQENKNAVRSAPQGSQNANESSVRFQFLLAAQNEVLIQQNKRIIELLELIAKKK